MYKISVWDSLEDKVFKYGGFVAAEDYVVATRKLVSYYSDKNTPIIDFYIQEIDFDDGVFDYGQIKYDLADELENYIN